MKICTCLEKQTKEQKKVSVSIGVWKTYFYDHKCDCEFECVGWRILHNCFYTNMYKQMPCFYLVRMIILYFIEHIYWCVCKRVCKLACMCECMWDLENEREKNVCNHFVHGFWKREEKRKKKWLARAVENCMASTQQKGWLRYSLSSFAIGAVLLSRSPLIGQLRAKWLVAEI